MTTVELDRQTLKLRLHFCPVCVERIKEQIPQRHRTWDSSEGAWFISTGRLNVLLGILKSCERADNPVLIDLRLWRDN